MPQEATCVCLRARERWRRPAVRGGLAIVAWTIAAAGEARTAQFLERLARLNVPVS